MFVCWFLVKVTVNDYVSYYNLNYHLEDTQFVPFTKPYAKNAFKRDIYFWNIISLLSKMFRISKGLNICFYSSITELYMYV